MPFVYRLQKILDFRVRKKEEQLLVVQAAQRNLTAAEQEIQKNNDEITQLKENQRKADYLMMEAYDKYLHHLWEKAEKLEIKRRQAYEILQEEIYKLVECEKAVKVLEKHKEKNKDIYLEEEKAVELKQLSEIAVQRHFQHSREKNQEEEELLRQIELIESEYGDGY